MRSLYLSLFFLIGTIHLSNAQHLFLKNAQFQTGDNAQWPQPAFDDRLWSTIGIGTEWESQGHDSYDGYAWYRIHVYLPESMLNRSVWKDSLSFYFGRIDDCDEVFFNGKKVGGLGHFPNQDGGFQTAAYSQRRYSVLIKDIPINWNGDNLIAVRVYDGGGRGGILSDSVSVGIVDLIDGVSIENNADFHFSGSKVSKKVSLYNNNTMRVSGIFTVLQKDDKTGKILWRKAYKIAIPANSQKQVNVVMPAIENVHLLYSFTEAQSGKATCMNEALPYILTPKASPFPQINGASAFGVRPGSPFLFKVPATGDKPLVYSATNLPKGLALNQNSGIITGTVGDSGIYRVNLSVKNKKGTATKDFVIKVGHQLALTPAMGWNSWNCWGGDVDQKKVESSALGMIENDLINHGWSYINVDDAWEAPERDEQGNIVSNQKFPDMKGLGDWLHSHGLKFGIYSSPGRITCGGYLGSLNHEWQDAHTYTMWGVDYLKYDWCSYTEVAGQDTTLETYIKPYRLMAQALKAQPRDIYYSLCQYGMRDVWRWGASIGANSWRTTGDITDTWNSLYEIGFNQYDIAGYASPGHWNDPDMLIVGKVGWGSRLHPTKLTPNEQYSHISLWSLQASPLLIGCDLGHLDDFTRSLLTNDEVIAVNQDTLGKQACIVLSKSGYTIYRKDLSDGSKAIGIFNLKTTFTSVSVDWEELQLSRTKNVRDLWRGKDLGMIKDHFDCVLPPHGVMLIKVTP